MNITPEIVNHIIRSRRSLFLPQMSGASVENSIIKEILKNAHAAPTHKLTAPWHFKVYDKKSMPLLTEKMIEIVQQYEPASAVAKTIKIRSFPEKLSHIIAICMKRDEKERLPEIEEIEAVACAVQNIYLSLQAYQLIGYWSTGNGTYTPEMKDFLGLGEKDKCLGFFFIGVPLPKINAPMPKKPDAETRIEWI